MAITDMTSGQGPIVPSRRWLVIVAAAALAAALILATLLGSAQAQGKVDPAGAPAACSAREPARAPSNGWASTRRSLAPQGAIQLRVCRYAGLGAHPSLRRTAQRLIRSRRVTARLTRELDRLPALRGPVACPADDGRAMVLHFAYPGRRRVTVAIGLSGCTMVTNGHLNRTAMRLPAGPKLLKQLESLT